MNKKYYEEHKDEIREKSRIHSIEYRKKNPEKIASYQKKYAMTHDRTGYYHEYYEKRKQETRNMSAIIVKEVGKKAVLKNTEIKYMTECGRNFIGAFPEKVHICDDLYLLVDEEGLPKELPINFLMEMKSKEWPIQKMVGTVVFFRMKPVNPCEEIYDYELEDLTEEDVKCIDEILSDEYQEQLKDKFQDYGRGEFVIKNMDPEDFMKMLFD